MSSPIISVENLSKAYRLGLKEEVPDTLTGAMKGVLRAPLRNLRQLRRLSTSRVAADDAEEDTLWALKDVSFEVNRGDVVGIIGRNGAGKSTLLKILSRITEPTSGRAVIRGRVSSLLEVGTGFHPDLSGRDNIYMNGTILGMTKKEIDRKFDEIVDFSGVEKFLDTPTKRYSSGMQVRLAFAVAAHLEPEILIVDEVLAVGDIGFQQKCMGRMQEVANAGRTVLFVSHNMLAVESLCSRAIEIYDGSVSVAGSVSSVIDAYRLNAMPKVRDDAVDANSLRYIRDVRLVDARGVPSGFVKLGGQFSLQMTIVSDRDLRVPNIGIGIDDLWGQRVLTLHAPARNLLVSPERTFNVHCVVDQLPLAPAVYTVKVALSDLAEQLDAIEKVIEFEVLEGDAFGEGSGRRRGVCIAPSRWSVLPNDAVVP